MLIDSVSRCLQDHMDMFSECLQLGVSTLPIEVFLFMSWNPPGYSQFGHEGTERISSYEHRKVYLTRSVDDGMTWSEPQDMTEQLKPDGMVWDAVGPGTGIQTKLGERAGRLVIPAIGRNIYSDDHGEHWVYQTMPTIDDRIVTLWQTRRQTQTNGT